jgi:hypothetical protein
MRHLAFNIEHALRETKEEGICKIVIFMHMDCFSLMNCPPFRVTRETIHILTTCYPETMGHCGTWVDP